LRLGTSRLNGRAFRVCIVSVSMLVSGRHPRRAGDADVIRLGQNHAKWTNQYF
jgi:hypothetical protein